jgi:hypothetical protein
MMIFDPFFGTCDDGWALGGLLALWGFVFELKPG